MVSDAGRLARFHFGQRVGWLSPDPSITLSGFQLGERALRTPHWVSLDQSLPEVLDLFQQGQSHVAFVSMNPQRQHLAESTTAKRWPWASSLWKMWWKN